MKPSHQPVQCDLFSSLTRPPPLASLQLRHDELVELLSQLLWAVIRSAETNQTSESGNEQDQP
jgi:hypothetical protein